MRRATALFLILSLTASLPSLSAGDLESRPAGNRPAKSRRHTSLGLTIGAVLGGILGAWAAMEVCESSGCESASPFFLTWSAFAAGGALLGYAASGGFSRDVDVALDEGREAVRRAAAERVPPGVAFAGLRLAHVPGFDGMEPGGEILPETAIPALAALR